MRRRNQAWTDDQIAILKNLIERKISLARASVILKRPQASVKNQARKLGVPFPGIREAKRVLKDCIAQAEERAGVRRV